MQTYKWFDFIAIRRCLRPFFGADTSTDSNSGGSCAGARSPANNLHDHCTICAKSFFVWIKKLKIYRLHFFQIDWNNRFGVQFMTRSVRRESALSGLGIGKSIFLILLSPRIFCCLVFHWNCFSPKVGGPICNFAKDPLAGSLYECGLRTVDSTITAVISMEIIKLLIPILVFRWPKRLICDSEFHLTDRLMASYSAIRANQLSDCHYGQ